MRGKTGKLATVSLAVICLLTACGSKELTNVTLIQTLGVDGAGPVLLTSVGDEEEAPAIYQTRGRDVLEAQEMLRELGETRLEVTHVAQLVVGPEAELGKTLWQELTHRDSGYGATVWLCGEGQTAGETLRRARDPARRLKALEENSGVRAPTILEALSTLTREGQVALPVLELEGEELTVKGYRLAGEG